MATVIVEWSDDRPGNRHRSRHCPPVCRPCAVPGRRRRDITIGRTAALRRLLVGGSGRVDCKTRFVAESWTERDKVPEYVDRVGKLPPRQSGEFELLEALPDSIESLLDLGCGDGRLARLVGDSHPELQRIVAVDTSQPMLELARSSLGTDDGVVVGLHDMNESISPLGKFGAVVSGFAIHHVSNERKQSLFAEIFEAVQPGGVFANLEVVRCATPDLHAEFYRRIGRTGDDPEDVLAPVEPQLEWMRAAGFADVDCQWRWRGFALLVGRRRR